MARVDEEAEMSHVKRLGALLLLAVVSVALSSAASAESSDSTLQPAATGDWSQLGFDASHSGFNRFETVITRSSARRLTELWAVPVGAIFSSPIVSGGRVFVGSADNHMYGLDAATGATLWVGPDQGTFFTSSAAAGNGLVFASAVFRTLLAYDAETGDIAWTSDLTQVRASPVLQDGTLYVASFDGRLDALDATTGTRKWAVRGACCVYDQAPVVDGTRIFQFRTDGSLTAYNTRTGRQLWKSTAYHSPGGTLAASGGRLFFKNGSTGIVAVDAATGTELWSVEVSTGGNGPPAVAYGRVFVTQSALPTSELTALDAATGALIWSQPVASVSGPSVANGVVYASSKNGEWSAFDQRDGTLLWSFTTPCSGDCINAEPVVANGILYLAAPDGYLYAFAPAP